jgi:anti-sigma-K factor RskA
MEPERPIGVDERPLDDAALEALAEAHAVAPRAGLRDRVLAAAKAEARVAREKRLASRWRIVGSVAAGLALVLGGLLAQESYRAGELAWESRKLKASNEELVARVDAQEKTLVAQERSLVSLQQALAAQVQVMRILAGPRTVTASLEPQEGGQGTGRVVVDAASGEAAIVLAGVTPLPPGKTYELWAIRGGKPPEPAGLFTVGPDGTIATRASRVERPEEVAVFAVSIEPEGGSTSPTGPIVMVGKVAG